jgi:DNA-binding Xre family transcriptional regulator
MSSPEVVMQVLRAKLRAAHVTYKVLAPRVGLSESSVKRVFGQKDMSLSRLSSICKAAGIAMEDVLRDAADLAPRTDMLTLAQEKSLASDPRLLLVAICCLGQWTLQQIVETYALTDAECIRSLARLDRLGLISLMPDNSYRLRVSLAFHWRPDGPAQQYLRAHIVPDYFNGDFNGVGETVLCVPARLSRNSADEMVRKIRQLSAELARLQQQDRRLELTARDGYTLLLGFRCWEFKAFTALRRTAAKAGSAHQIGPKNK